MSATIAHTDAERVSGTTESRIARLLRSNLKLYRHARVRGEIVTIWQAARRSGLGLSELERRIEAGDLPAHHALVVDMADLAEEEDDQFVSSTRKYLSDLCGDDGSHRTDEWFDEKFGPRAKRIARTRGEKVAS